MAQHGDSEILPAINIIDVSPVNKFIKVNGQNMT